VQRLNASAETVLGSSAARAAGKSFYTLFPAFAGFKELLQRALTNRQSFGQELSMPSPLRDGTVLDLVVRVTPLTDTDVRDLLVIELIDATQRHQIDRENALITQHGVSRRMISQLAHEIRNPLGGLRGAAQLLERELPSKELREFTRIIIREADRLDGLMDSLVGPVGQFRKDAVNLHELLEHVAVLVETEVGGDFVVQRDYDPSLPAMWLDKNRLIQALLNLARNAVQATGAAGMVLFRTRVLTNTVVGQDRHRLVASIDVEDDGPGVPDEIADTIFYPLVSGRDDGTGLGLPLAQDLVSRHNGLIEYQSEPGRTVFMVRLPIDVDPDSPAAATRVAKG
jgi:two-component system nitrogen regulation sensor histidine kinase GlnL